MKKFLISLIAILNLFVFTTQKDTDFDLCTLEYIDDYVIMTFRMTSDNIMVINHDLTYNSNELELIKVDPNSYFTYTEGKPQKDGDNVTINMLFDSDSAFKSIEYAQIYFKPKTEDLQSYVTVSNIKSSDLDYKLDTSYSSRFQVIVKDEKVSVTKEEFDITTQIRSFLITNKITVFIIIGVIVGLYILNKIIRSISNSAKKNKKAFKNNNETFTPVQNNNGAPQYFTDQKSINPNQQSENNEAFQELLEEEKEAKEEAINDDVIDGKYEVFIILLLVASLIFASTVYAENTSIDKIDTIRNLIVTGKYEKDEDINNDDKIDVVDLVYCIDTENTLNKGYIKFNSTIEREMINKTEATESTEATTKVYTWDDVR